MKALFTTKNFYFLVFLIFLGSKLTAQTRANHVIVYLSDKSFRIGNIIETLHKSYGNIDTNDNDLFTKIKTDDGQIITISWKKIKRIKRINPFTIIFKDGKTFSTKGFYNVSQLSMSFGTFEQTEFGTSGLHLHSINGYQFNSLILIGVGLGIDIYSPNFAKLNFLPIYTDLRGFLFKKKVSPYYSIKTGYGFNLKKSENGNKAKGGLFFNPEIGVKFATKKLADFQLGIAYRFQKIDTLIEDISTNNFSISTNGFLRRSDIVLSWLF